MLDMEGVFSVASSWVDKEPTSDSKLLQEEATAEPQQLGGLDVGNFAQAADLKPSEIELIMTGKPESSMSTKKFADSILFDLSDEDRDVLEKMNHM